MVSKMNVLKLLAELEAAMLRTSNKKHMATINAIVHRRARLLKGTRWESRARRLNPAAFKV
jgi:hypothetical protein